MHFSDPRVAGQWLLPEVRAAFLLEFQADVGQQEDWTETGTSGFTTAKKRNPGTAFERVTTTQPCPPAPLQKVWPGSVRQMFIQTFHHPPDGLRVWGARVRQLPRVHHWRRVGNSRPLCFSCTLHHCAPTFVCRSPKKSAPVFSFVLSSRAPTATFHDSKHGVVYMHYEATTGNLLTSGTDKVIKVWTSHEAVKWIPLSRWCTLWALDFKTMTHHFCRCWLQQ